MRKVLVAVVAAGALVACSGEGGGEGEGGGGGDAPAPQPSAAQTTQAAKAKPPAQPTSGYGGSDYAHQSVRRTELTVERGGVTLFEPAGPAPKEAPVVLQTQIGGAEGYLGWIEHVVRRGSIVIYMDAPLSGATDAERIGGPVANYRTAVRELAKPGRVRPDWDRAVFVGHSIGGVIASRIAAVAPAQKLPGPKAIFAVQPPVADPGDTRPLKAVPATTRLVVMASDRDDRVGTGGAEALWQALGHVRTKQYVFVRSDDHGDPALEAGHLFPLSGPGEDSDALDHVRLWAVLDALQDCVSANRGCGLAPVQARWSDGRAMIAQEVRNKP